MLNGNVFYHGILRKTIVGFGRLFSDIYIDRKEGDSVKGTTVQRLQVPIAYAPKEKWIVRLDSDPDLNNHTYTTLPRMSFEITGYSYDPSRKMNRVNKIMCKDSTTDPTMKYTYSPVPYNIDVSLYILTKTQEDAMQIIEQILPTFNPEYTLTINMLRDLNIMQDTPVILDSITVSDEYDGDFQTRRFVTHTLNFTLKTNLYGNVNSAGVITNVQADVSYDDSSETGLRYTATGTPTTRTIVEENWEENL